MTELPDPGRPNVPRPQSPEAAPTHGLSNGLFADSYVPLTDVDPEVAQRILDALLRARIPAYLSDGTALAPASFRLYVASAERSDARGVVAAVVRSAGARPGATQPSAGRADGDGTVAAPPPTPPRDDPLAGIDTDAAFAEIVADWHVDTHRAIRDAERQLNHEDEDWQARLVQPAADANGWLDEDHYVPPTPPPLPHMTATTAAGVVLVIVAIVLLGFGTTLGLPLQLSLLLGVSAVLTALGLLIMRLRERPDDEDDGAIL